MKIYCVGDSLTEGDYGVYGKTCIANIHKENYPYFLALLTGHETVNCGKCGYTASSYLNYYKDGNVKFEKADLILVLLGTNGGLDPVENTEGNEDYERLLELFSSDAPGAEIVLCTPPHVTSDPGKSGCGCAEKVGKAVGFVRKFASEKGYRLIDLAACPDFTAETEDKYQYNDGVHFIEAGYRRLAEIIAGQF